jgi:hypothetical protein
MAAGANAQRKGELCLVMALFCCLIVSSP